jgi:hypothetical protein
MMPAYAFRHVARRLGRPEDHGQSRIARWFKVFPGAAANDRVAAAMPAITESVTQCPPMTSPNRIGSVSGDVTENQLN